MKKFLMITLLFLVAFSSSVSCKKEMSFEDESNVMDKPFAQESFSKILSKAVSENQDLRSFIHTVALQQFDNDYDVFYPFVKDRIVSQSRSFRDILLEYTDETTLVSIEKALPKLNILVPDWSWLGAFSVHSWDPSDDVAVSFDKPDGYIGVYHQGEYLGELPDSSFPDFPVLIIKENERMKYSPGTRGADGHYDFVDDVFNNALTRVEHQHYDIQIDGTPDVSNFVADSDVNYRVKKAFAYFSGEQSIYQRDYLYYNMTAPNQAKERYDNIWECIHKFKFQDYNSSFIHDDFPQAGNDSSNICHDFVDHIENRRIDYTKNDYWQSPQELRDVFYSDGSLELVFVISIPNKNGGVYTSSRVKSVSFADVFAIDHADLDLRHKTWFVKDWFVYTIERSYIKPRWCLVDWDLPSWDISQEGTMITISVGEFDEKGSTTIEHNVKKNWANNFKVDGELSNIPVGKSAKAKVDLGYSHTGSHESSEKVTWSRGQEGIDFLGTTEWEYITPIIEKRTYKDGKLGYEIHTITTGTIDLMILPKSY